MTEQQKILRVFKLIRLLKERPGRTIGQLAQALETTARSVYRYLNLLESIGYAVDHDGKPPRYFIFEDESLRQPHFTEEEAQLIRQAMAGIIPTHPLLAGIQQKLFLASTLQPLTDGVVDLHQGKIVQKLGEAIRERQQVQLIQYQSANSNTISNRIVEPLSFTEDFSVLYAYELVTGQEKTFKTRRIEDVIMLDKPCHYRSHGEPVDLFDWTGPEKIAVELALTQRAYHLLLEDYPSAKAYVGKNNQADFPYFFKAEVRDFRGVGRYILGLPGEIRVEAPEELRGYLRGRIREFVL
ncbi:YafY family protein [Siphonobacter sp. SORGH_AS_1065]|uniref:helix-turn-helix transcriptional regulator n=1 Tax=Siphonobacter sp. SORGH_AS_1065 TaxID=3041795 RepID=UPI00277F2CFB|nr:WYL domain-containing protein [Siphonobacter sp. SORGH_AS_1065]MDQ1086164.1 proteasome accessory factor C [Siphonobacter sp. SORGH_AS_1065]